MKVKEEKEDQDYLIRRIFKGVIDRVARN